MEEELEEFMYRFNGRVSRLEDINDDYRKQLRAANIDPTAARTLHPVNAVLYSEGIVYDWRDPEFINDDCDVEWTVLNCTTMGQEPDLSYEGKAHLAMTPGKAAKLLAVMLGLETTKFPLALRVDAIDSHTCCVLDQDTLERVAAGEVVDLG